MKTCKGCKYAVWERTRAGRLHPSGEGKCDWKYKPPPLPRAFYYLGGEVPAPLGGYINRHEEFTDHCPYWSAAQDDAK